jgi:hypothetical protein
MFLMSLKPQQFLMKAPMLSFAKREGASIMMRENSSRLRMPDESDYQAFRASPIVAFRDGGRAKMLGVSVKSVIVVVAITSVIVTTAVYMFMSHFH